MDRVLREETLLRVVRPAVPAPVMARPEEVMERTFRWNSRRRSFTLPGRFKSNGEVIIMDVVFICPNCRQELAADASLAGTQIQCPSCNEEIKIPHADPSNIRTLNPIATSAAAREEKHFVVPVHDEPTEVLIEKPPPALEVAAKEEDKKVRIKTIRRTDCIEVGHDRFDEVVTQFLGKIGQENIISINTLNYTHLDIGTQKLMTEFGVLIVYKG